MATTNESKVAIELTPDLSPELLALVEELQAAKRDRDAADARLLNLCMTAEKERVSLWREHWATFDKFLEKFRIVDSTRYREYVAAMKMKDVAASADDIGVAAVLQAGKIANVGRRTKFLEGTRERMRATGGPLSDQQARTMRLRIGGSQPMDSAWNRSLDERAKLRQEKLDLERQLYDVIQERDALREENEKLKKKLAEKKGK